MSRWFQPDEMASEWALVTPNEAIRWAEFAARVEQQTLTYQSLAGQRVGYQLAANIDSMVRFFALLAAEPHLFLMAADTTPDQVATWAVDWNWNASIDTQGGLREHVAKSAASAATAITILTSGTTGKPKAARHTWQSLTRPVRITEATRGSRWLLTFRPHLYAGLQVIAQCLLNYGSLALPGDHSDAESVVALAVHEGIQYASATPSYWRWLLTFAGERLSEIPLRQITLGGEAVDQATLDSLRATFTKARIVHIYATTELGRCFSVTDGIAGFPVHYLDGVSEDGVELRIEDGELVVRSANAMQGYDEADANLERQWFHTKDLVEVRGDRVLFVGRTTDMINVGGNKVYPLEVESVIRPIPGVLDVRVHGEPSSIIGELVKCEVVLQPGQDPGLVEAEIRKRTVADLANYQRPRFIAFVDEIPRTAAGKVKR